MQGVQLVFYLHVQCTPRTTSLHYCICLVSEIMECTLKIVCLVRGADGVANFITFDEQLQKSGGCSFPSYASDNFFRLKCTDNCLIAILINCALFSLL